MEDRVPRCRARFRGDRYLIRRPETPVGEREQKCLIESLVRDDHELSGWVENHRVRMRRGLLHRIWTGCSSQGHELTDGREKAIRLRRNDGDCAGTVVRHYQKSFGAIESRINWIVALATNLIQQCKVSAGAINRERADEVPSAMDRIQHGMIAA